MSAGLIYFADSQTRELAYKNNFGDEPEQAPH